MGMRTFIYRDFPYDETWKKQLKEKGRAIEEINYILHEAGFDLELRHLIGNGKDTVVNINPIMPDNPFFVFTRNGGYIKPKKGRVLKSKGGLGSWIYNSKMNIEELVEIVKFIYSNRDVEARLPSGTTPHFFDRNWYDWWRRYVEPSSYRKVPIPPEPEVDERIFQAVFEVSGFTEDSEQHVSRSIPSSVRQKVWLRDEGKCVKCGSKQNLHFDHIIPYSKGGSSTENNLEILCFRCNISKSDKVL